MKIFKWFLIVFLVGVLIFLGYLGTSIYQFSQNIYKENLSDRFENVKNKDVAFTPPIWNGEEPINVLLVGGDARGLKKGEIPRSDTMMVASIDPKSGKSAIFSILRDTYVKIPGFKSDRINVAITLGGPKLAMQTVSEYLGIPIQYYVYTDFQGFINAVNALGGVEIDVEKRMQYSSKADGPLYDINLQPGLQRLYGQEALQYVRFRHDAQSDFARTERQRKFMKALGEQLEKGTSILKLPKVLNNVSPYVETNMEFGPLLHFARLAYAVDTTKLQSEQIPPMPLLKETNKNGAAVIEADADALKKHVQEVFAR